MCAIKCGEAQRGSRSHNKQFRSKYLEEVKVDDTSMEPKFALICQLAAFCCT
jgi:hypothetical protein